MSATLATLAGLLTSMAGDNVEHKSVILPRFDGRGSIREWMSDYKVAARGAAWTQNQKLVRLPLFFGPEPKTAYRAAESSAEENKLANGFDTSNFEGMSDYLIDIFSGGDDISECERSLDEIHQLQGQTVTSFYLQLKGALARARNVFQQRNVEDHITDKERQKKKFFMKGLRDPQMRMWVETQSPADLESAWGHAKTYERIYGSSSGPACTLRGVNPTHVEEVRTSSTTKKWNAEILSKMEAMHQEMKALREGKKRKVRDESDSDSESDSLTSSKASKRRRSARQAQTAAIEQKIAHLHSIVAALPALQQRPVGLPAAQPTSPYVPSLPPQQPYAVAPSQQGYSVVPPYQSYAAVPPPRPYSGTSSQSHQVVVANPPTRQQQPTRRNNGRGLGRGRRRVRRDLASVECYRCHRYGHYRSACPDIQRSLGRPRLSAADGNYPQYPTADAHGLQQTLAYGQRAPTGTAASYSTRVGAGQGNVVAPLVPAPPRNPLASIGQVHPQRLNNVFQHASVPSPSTPADEAASQGQLEQNRSVSAQSAQAQIASLQSALAGMQNSAQRAGADPWSL
jgi:hypothetical protein